ncbi:hypothetical protein Q4489_09365 [Thalassotalea sp. 1_MG-2023]|nr:hypothetical protein [Thalassotalea sp. 1_MG-2023]MDO6427221.1 hypothetical protein [Thalassotalea sp. 1_MG-2023]
MANNDEDIAFKLNPKGSVFGHLYVVIAFACGIHINRNALPKYQ